MKRISVGGVTWLKSTCIKYAQDESGLICKQCAAHVLNSSAARTACIFHYGVRWGAVPLSRKRKKITRVMGWYCWPVRPGSGFTAVKLSIILSFSLIEFQLLVAWIAWHSREGSLKWKSGSLVGLRSKYSMHFTSEVSTKHWIKTKRRSTVWEYRRVSNSSSISVLQ